MKATVHGREIRGQEQLWPVPLAPELGLSTSATSGPGLAPCFHIPMR